MMITVVVENEDDWIGAEPAHASDLIRGQLMRAFASDQDRPAAAVGKGYTEGGSRRPTNRAPQNLCFHPYVISQRHWRKADARTAGFQKNAIARLNKGSVAGIKSIHRDLVRRISSDWKSVLSAFVIPKSNVGLMQAVRRFDPDRGFRLATYAMWWIRASIQEYILRSWSLVKMGTTAAQKKLFFNLRRAKSQLQALDEGDLKPEHVKKIATKLGVPEEDVVNMNRRLGGDASLNAPIRAKVGIRRMAGLARR